MKWKYKKTFLKKKKNKIVEIIETQKGSRARRIFSGI